MSSQHFFIGPPTSRARQCPPPCRRRTVIVQSMCTESHKVSTTNTAHNSASQAASVCRAVENNYRFSGKVKQQRLLLSCFALFGQQQQQQRPNYAAGGGRGVVATKE